MMRALVLLLLSVTAAGSTSKQPVACYMYAADGTALTQTAGALNISGGTGGGTASAVAITDGTTTTQKASVSAGGALKVDASGTTVPVSGTFFQSTQPVSGTLTCNVGSSGSLALDATLTGGTQKSIVRGGAKGSSAAADVTSTATDANHQAMDVNVNNTVPVSGTVTTTTALQASSAVIGHVIVDTAPTTAVTGPVTDAQMRASAVPVSLASLPALATGSAVIGHVIVDTAPSTAVTNAGTFAVQDAPPTLTKGTQGSTGFTVQNLMDAGRNQTNYFMAVPVVTTATDALMSLTGYKAGAAVAATTTPAVVTSGKTYRVTKIVMTYVAIATAGSAKFTLRANTGGVVAIGSPAVVVWVIGGPAAAAGVSQTVDIAVPEGMEFAAGTGIGISLVGLSATQVAAAVGYGQISIEGYEY